MARSSAVEYRQVADACYTLFQAGEPTSFQRVYDAIGNRGSSRVVNDFIKQWRGEAAEKLSVSHARNLPGLPEGLVSAADEILIKFWQAALGQAEQSYQVALGELEMQRSEMQAEREREQLEMEELREKCRQSAVELTAAKQLIAERDIALAESKAANQEQLQQLRERDVALGAAREEVARLSATLDAAQRQHATDLANAQVRSEELLADARRTHHVELEREREVAAGERKYLMQTTDEIRQSARHTETQLRAELSEAKTMSESYRQQAYKTRDDLARWQGRAEAAEAMLAKMTTRKEKRRPEGAAPKG